MGLRHSVLSIMADIEGCAYEGSIAYPHSIVSDQIAAIRARPIQGSGRFVIVRSQTVVSDQIVSDQIVAILARSIQFEASGRSDRCRTRCSSHFPELVG